MDSKKIFIINIFGLILKTVHLQNCLVTNSTSSFGTLTKSCFSASVSTLSEIVVHTSSASVVGITFNFLNNASASYIENQASMIYLNQTIDLRNGTIIGIEVGGGPGIDSLSFQMYNSSSNTTVKAGGNSSNSSRLDTSALVTNYFELTSIYACIDCNNTISNLPSVMFDYRYNQCSTVLWKEWNPWTQCYMFR